MKYLFGLVLISPFALAQTVINYEDGSTYTLVEGEDIYITTEDSQFFKRTIYSSGSTYFVVQSPWSRRDYINEPAEDYPVGSHEWCKTYIPEGFTFGTLTWQRLCDSNRDGVYDENDDGWSE